MKISKTKIIIILSILLVLSLFYISYEKYQSYTQQQKTTTYNQGFIDGVSQTIITIQQTGQIPVLLNSTTINWVDLNEICEND